MLLQTSPELGQLAERLVSGTGDAQAHRDKALLMLPLPHSVDKSRAEAPQAAGLT